MRQRFIVRGVFWVYYFVVVMGGSALIISWNFFISSNDPIYTTTDLVIGIIAGVTMGSFWMPQIWTTFKLKDAGSLSLIMLLLTTPGAYLTVYFYLGIPWILCSSRCNVFQPTIKVRLYGPQVLSQQSVKLCSLLFASSIPFGLPIPRPPSQSLYDCDFPFVLISSLFSIVILASYERF